MCWENASEGNVWCAGENVFHCVERAPMHNSVWRATLLHFIHYDADMCKRRERERDRATISLWAVHKCVERTREKQNLLLRSASVFTAPTCAHVVRNSFTRIETKRKKRCFRFSRRPANDKMRFFFFLLFIFFVFLFCSTVRCGLRMPTV